VPPVYTLFKANSRILFLTKETYLSITKGNGVFLLNRPEKLMAPTDN
jgi:hypothetical protein